MSASVFAKFKSEVVLNGYVDVKFLSGGRRMCREICAGGGAYWGGSLKILGVNLEEETPICYENQARREGPD